MTKRKIVRNLVLPKARTPTKNVQWDSLAIVVEALNALPGFFRGTTIMMMLLKTINKDGEQEAPRGRQTQLTRDDCSAHPIADTHAFLSPCLYIGM
mmetsp:Transcript_10858/g.14568  ORF Transcript_10858/g.14568 Transcript_10858/m.14568 type:complete len:96 (-) Transcript_10858:31-318(-)